MLYDIVTVGGGLAGAALARTMAASGAQVLVVEREDRFNDRVRAEGLLPWGAAELERLGLRQRLLAACATENRWWDDYLGPIRIAHRDTAADTPGRIATLTFPHPAMQEALLDDAGRAGADVWRGAHVIDIAPGRPALVEVHRDGRTSTIAARLVVGADGRRSCARRWGGFPSQADPPRLRTAGLLLENLAGIDRQTTLMVVNPELGQSAILFPQREGRVRAYVVVPSRGTRRFSGTRGVPSFLAELVRTGIDRAALEGARPAGPLATFEGADTWVDHPYRPGVALVGDAAATCDPAWGQGLSLALRDVRVLSEALTGSDDWDAAGHAYADAHARGFAVIHATEDWFSTLFLDTGPDADARRARALPLIADEPERVPDAFMSGPDFVSADDAARRRFFGEA